jgi:peroxiredoxin
LRVPRQHRKDPQAGAVVLGISPDAPEKPARWREKENFPAAIGRA